MLNVNSQDFVCARDAHFGNTRKRKALRRKGKRQEHAVFLPAARCTPKDPERAPTEPPPIERFVDIHEAAV